jgi:hypothetical protein
MILCHLGNANYVLRSEPSTQALSSQTHLSKGNLYVHFLHRPQTKTIISN